MFPLAALSPPMMIVDLVFSLLMLLVGFGMGWGLCRAYASAPESAGGVDAERAAAILARIGDLASSVATDVDAHSSRVAQCSSDLAEAANSDDPNREQRVIDSLSEILKANERLQEQLASAEGQLQRQAAELEEQTTVARTDALTSLFNRRALDDEINRRMAEWQRRQSVFTLVMIDVDHFKKFNDTHGHQAGDEVLRGVGAVLAKTMREMDMVARFGGEEFAVVLPATNLSEGRRAAERARRCIEESVFTFGKTQLRVNASVGVAEVIDVDNMGTLVKRADEALYAAKKAGRNCVWYHDGDGVFASAGAAETAKPVAEAAGAAALETSPAAAPAGSTAAADPNGDAPAATFANDLRRRLAECQQFKLPLSVIFVDIDELPKLVAEWGPAVSDAVFKALFEIADEVRGDMGFVSRLNARLAIVIPGADLDAASDLAERLREVVLKGRARLRGKPINHSVSVGIAEGVAGDTFNSLCQRVDAAVLASKASGKNCTHVHTGTICRRVAQVAVGASG